MKKIVSILLCAAMIATFALGFAACSEPSEDPSSTEASSSSSTDATISTVVAGELHMATNASFPPYEMIADDAVSFEGIDVEIATAIANKLGLKLVVDDMDFNAVITAVQQGKSDIAMAGLTVSEDRKKNVNFTDSYATGVQVIIVKEDSSIASADDLEGKMIGTQEATTGYLYCSDDYGEDNVIPYANGANAVQALVNGKVDCVVIDNEPAKAYVKANAGLKILDTEYITEDYAIGVSKDNDALLNAVNDALKELISDGTVATIVAKYISAE